MMTPIEILSDDELKLTLELISAKKIKDDFRSYPRSLRAIAPGMVAKQMTDIDAVKMMVKGRKTPHVMGFVNNQINAWVREINSARKQKKSEGMTDDEALAAALADSPFSNHVWLYFKIADESNILGRDFTRSIESRVREIVRSKEEVNDTLPAVSEESKCVVDEEEQTMIEELQNKLLTLTDSEKALKQENADLQSKLAESQKKNELLKESLAERESQLADFHRRAKYDDTRDDYVEESEYDHISLCEVLPPDVNGYILMTRLADISHGVLQKYYPIEDIPKLFDNRDRIYRNGGPSESGTIGVWNWTAVPNKNDPEKDYINSEYNSAVLPIQIIIVADCDRLSLLIENLKQGIKAYLHPGKYFFAYYEHSNRLSGLLCKESELDIADGVVKLKESVMNLPRYTVDTKDVIWLEKRSPFYCRTNLGLPEAIVQIRESMAIVSDVVKSRVSWPIFKAKGFSKNDWRSFKSYIEDLPTSDIISDIQKRLGCSNAQALQLYEEYKQNAGQYLDGNSLDDEVISSALSTNSALFERCTELASKEWHSQNAALLNEAEAELAKAHMSIAEAKEKAGTIEQEIKNLTERSTELDSEISEKEQLADKVERLVAERINNARDNAAEFLATMAFSPVCSASERNSTVGSTPHKGNAAYAQGETLDETGLEEYPDVKTAIETISFELAEAGVQDKFTYPLAAYLYSCFVNRYSILLAGPNASDIADAFSSALFGKKAAKLICEGEYDTATVSECAQSGSEIVNILNPFSSNWISRIPDIVHNEEQFYILTHPYSEDIQIEPQSIYNYYLPLFTEFFVDKQPSRHFVGGRKSSSFKEFKLHVQEPKYQKTISVLRTRMLVKNRIQTVLTNMEAMIGEPSPDAAFLFAILPYAYATMQIETLADVMKEKKELSISSDMTRAISAVFGEFE